MATDVQVRRRHIYKDYFNQTSGGYFGNATSAPGSNKHWENARLTDLTSYDIVYTYGTPFKVIPIGQDSIAAYRFVENPEDASSFIKENVLCYFPLNLSPLTQLLLRIDASEVLEGVIIDFILTE